LRRIVLGARRRRLTREFWRRMRDNWLRVAIGFEDRQDREPPNERRSDKVGVTSEPDHRTPKYGHLITRFMRSSPAIRHYSGAAHDLSLAE
jgi:hypothetical protein